MSMSMSMSMCMCMLHVRVHAHAGMNGTGDGPDDGEGAPTAAAGARTGARTVRRPRVGGKSCGKRAQGAHSSAFHKLEDAPEPDCRDAGGVDVL